MCQGKQATIANQHSQSSLKNLEHLLFYRRKVSTCIPPENYLSILNQYHKDESDVKCVRQDSSNMGRFCHRKLIAIESHAQDIFTGASAFCSCLGKKCIIDIDLTASKVIVTIRKKGLTSHRITVFVHGIEINNQLTD